MRVTKFRGKRITDGRWVYGGIAASPQKDSATIHTYDDDGYYARGYFVDPATIGQFTGLTDRNGKEIYEGDILRTPPKTDYDKKNFVAYEVFWHDNDCASHHIGWQMNRCHFQGCICGTTYIPEFLPKTTATMEVVGNIHDNPELLGKKGGEE